MNECNEYGCETSHGYKDCGCQSNESCSTCSSCDSSCGSCGSSDMIMAMWHKAAMAAMLEAKKDILKKKFQAVYGDALEKGADAVVEAIGKKIQSSVQQEQAMSTLKSKMASIISETVKKN